MGESCSGDDQVVSADHLAAFLKVRPQSGVGPGDLKGEWEHGNREKKALYESFPTSTAYRPVGTMHPVKELRSRHGGQSDRLIAQPLQEGLWSLAAALDRDEHAGIDQEGQGASPTDGCSL